MEKKTSANSYDCCYDQDVIQGTESKSRNRSSFGSHSQAQTPLTEETGATVESGLPVPTDASVSAIGATSAVATILAHLGYDPLSPALQRTPQRVVDHLRAACSGEGHDPAARLRASLMPTDGYDGIILLDNLTLHSHCEHHLTPITGVIHIAYKPDRHMVGIGAIAEMAQLVAQRLQIQERLTQQIADALEDALQPAGLMVSAHTNQHCLTTRGPKQYLSKTHTAIARGCFSDNAVLQQYFLAVTSK